MKKKDPCSDPAIPVIPKNGLADALQQAIQLEIATIPVYLYTYYSINRTPKQEDLIEQILTDMPKTKDKDKAAKKAKELAIEIQVFANKAGALIMSVAVEEMLHMALSSNVKQSLIGPPDLVNKTPEYYPTKLLGHIPEFQINLHKFSLKQLHTFLLIESPDPFPDYKPELTRSLTVEYKTIGQLYEAIICCIKKNYPRKSQYNTKRPQLAPNKGYYAQNSIESVHYDKKHNPHFANSDDSGDLVRVVDKTSALKALEEVMEQGEGKSGTPDHLDKAGNVRPDVCKRINAGEFADEDYDDPDKKELSHFVKFLELYCKMEQLSAQFKKIMKDKDFNFEKYFVKNVPHNPTKEDYPTEDLRNYAELGNAVTSYLFFDDRSLLL